MGYWEAGADVPAFFAAIVAWYLAIASGDLMRPRLAFLRFSLDSAEFILNHPAIDGKNVEINSSLWMDLTSQH